MGDSKQKLAEGLAYITASNLWVKSSEAAHGVFCNCGDPANHLLAALNGQEAAYLLGVAKRCPSTTTPPLEENMPTSEDKDGSDGTVEDLLAAYEGDTQGENK
ncbi:putative ORF2 [Torque teno didelphis albiventris virus]|uniref:Putative ORF2 n=1 Tax=Torque teno didelphis albiventris virus TaxID=2054619 RepID=A0A2H4QBS7_9VIRU|nr:putative ORF2 [Torque teno didelphis albiventris virus]ATX61859.1 putative ORF2 [Torque teno didelphis albiventris virus]